MLNKGGAGKSITRQETSDRLSSLMRQYNEIMLAYDATIPLFGGDEAAGKLEAMAHEVRDEIAKFSELILSAGHVPPLGTDLEPGDVAVGTTRQTAIKTLSTREQAFLDDLKKDKKIRHMYRTVALLDNTRVLTSERLKRLKNLA